MLSEGSHDHSLAWRADQGHQADWLRSGPGRRPGEYRMVAHKNVELAYNTQYCTYQIMIFTEGGLVQIKPQSNFHQLVPT